MECRWRVLNRVYHDRDGVNDQKIVMAPDPRRNSFALSSPDPSIIQEYYWPCLGRSSFESDRKRLSLDFSADYRMMWNGPKRFLDNPYIILAGWVRGYVLSLGPVLFLQFLLLVAFASPTPLPRGV